MVVTTAKLMESFAGVDKRLSISLQHVFRVWMSPLSEVQVAVDYESLLLIVFQDLAASTVRLGTVLARR